jgi:hypothetical protein
LQNFSYQSMRHNYFVWWSTIFSDTIWRFTAISTISNHCMPRTFHSASHPYTPFP